MNKFLGKRFPGIAHYSRIFILGFKDLVKDFGLYVNIQTKVWTNSQGVKKLDRKEMELYYRLPKEISRVAPTLIISTLPLAQYFMFPIAFYFPKQLLSSHFWSIQQKSEFPVEMLRDKQKYYKPVFRMLQSSVSLIDDGSQRDLFQNTLYKLGSGTHPTHAEILELVPFFESKPFSLSHMYSNHANVLCHMHGVRAGWLRRKSRLVKTATIIQNLDFSIEKEGMVEMKIDELRTACFLRGLNASNTPEEEMHQYMNDWISISTTLLPSCYSLILHLPIFLGYNNTNRAFID